MKSKNETQQQNEIRPYTLKQIAALYKVSYKTLYSWLKPFREEVGKIRGRCLTIPQVRTIFEKLDYPPGFSPDAIKEMNSDKS